MRGFVIGGGYVIRVSRVSGPELCGDVQHLEACPAHMRALRVAYIEIGRD